MFFKLWTRAPRTTMLSDDMPALYYSEKSVVRNPLL
jgi:hypothetical protein